MNTREYTLAEIRDVLRKCVYVGYINEYGMQRIIELLKMGKDEN